MYLSQIKVTNFRLLHDISLEFDNETTVIVGRNNSGKTSITDLFKKIDSPEKPNFIFQDFSLVEHENFWDGYQQLISNNLDDLVEDNLSFPKITITFTFEYSENEFEYGGLSDVMIDLDPECRRVIAIIEYKFDLLKASEFIDEIKLRSKDDENLSQSKFFQIISSILPRYFTTNIFAQNPIDASNQNPLKWTTLRNLFNCNFIGAQRAIDDNSRSDRAVLSRIVESVFSSASNHPTSEEDKEIVELLVSAVSDVQTTLNENFNSHLSTLIPTLRSFGYPGLIDPEIRTQTILEVEQLMNNNTTVGYELIKGVILPESYNGLGPRNLIYIILKLYEFYKVFISSEPNPIAHLIFIEEPEAHLHPQMQSVFIKQINQIKERFASQGDVIWPVQFIITTHSSHIANEANFNSMRYFMTTPCEENEKICFTTIKDLRNGIIGEDPQNLEFLHKYMTLTKCDLFFADRAILIEGAAERLLLPKMIEKIDTSQTAGEKLSSQYLSIVEVGGAYAHIFFPLLDFLGLRSLIITDIDTVNSNDGGKKCQVSIGTHSSNYCIKTWFSENGDDGTKQSIKGILEKEEKDKIKGKKRLAYQIPEQDSEFCGRSFEDAFIFANLELFNLNGINEKDLEAEVWTKANKENKTSFALKYAINQTEWNIPRYIKEGLTWLAQNQ